ncbi:DUF882 domain-containing protein [Devosia sp.]|uniref:DUF882 domain-containing protein n=1 Tax=Devosia sp. TaxID=1871048 RepID=UPI003A920D88
MPRLLLAAVMCWTMLLPATVIPAQAAGDTRTLNLYYTHNGTSGKFTFKRNGKYDQKVLRQLNVFLADWRTKEPTKMDPALFDLLWSVYREVGATQPINIVSSYRSPKTNEMLRSKSSGVAKNSQHTQGKAMDFFIPGINLSRLREVAMKHQVGGVGYYPTSGSPFVHLDTAGVRAWPRMTRAQLKKLFPDGKTLHLPTDGKPLSSKGRAYAQAEWTRCHTVPCNGRITFDSSPGIMIAEADGGIAPIPQTKPKDLYERDGTIMMASLEEPAQRMVSTVQVAAPVPLPRPDSYGETETADADTSGDETGTATFDALGAPIPAVKSPRLKLATRSPLSTDGETALAALSALDDDMPKPRVLMTPRDELVTAYAPENTDSRAEKALRTIIDSEPSVATLLPKPAPLDPDAPLGDTNPDLVDSFATASLGDTDALRGMFEMTFSALSDDAGSQPMADALAKVALKRQLNPSIERREIALVAPELNHVNETLVQPVPMSTEFWAVMNEAEGYLEKGTELGPLTGRVEFIPVNAPIVRYDRFVTGTNLLVASR